MAQTLNFINIISINNWKIGTQRHVVVSVHQGVAEPVGFNPDPTFDINVNITDMIY